MMIDLFCSLLDNKKGVPFRLEAGKRRLQIPLARIDLHLCPVLPASLSRGIWPDSSPWRILSGATTNHKRSSVMRVGFAASRSRTSAASTPRWPRLTYKSLKYALLAGCRHGLSADDPAAPMRHFCAHFCAQRQPLLAKSRL